MHSHHEYQMDLAYECLIESHIEHLMSEYDRLSTDDARPQLWFLSATFIPFRYKPADHVPIPLDRCLAYFERFYVHMLPRLMSNFERKRHLQPLTYLYADYPFTKKDKTYAPLTPNEKFDANRFRPHLEHPETNPHVHALMLLPPGLIDRFKAILPELEKLFRGLCQTNCTFHAVAFEPADIRNVIFYAVSRDTFSSSPPSQLNNNGDDDVGTTCPARATPVETES